MQLEATWSSASATLVYVAATPRPKSHLPVALLQVFERFEMVTQEFLVYITRHDMNFPLGMTFLCMDI